MGTDGSNDSLRAEATTGLPTGATPGELWVMYSHVSGNNQAIVRYGGASTGVRSIGRTSANTYNITDGTTTVSLSADPIGIIAAIFEATEYTPRFNGFQQVGGTGATLNTSTTRITIGGNNAATAAGLWNGVIRHVLVTTLLTLSQRQALEGWLAWDSGLQHRLPATHPYRWAISPA
jgi:hypothetical protein